MLTAKPTTEEEPLRKVLLQDAIKAIVGDRNHQYGPPGQDFTRIAALLNDLGFKFEPVDEGEYAGTLEPYHVAMIMMCLKLSRLTWGPDKRDSWLDLAGYAGCGWEVFVERSQ